jgi:hypothetical protein
MAKLKSLTLMPDHNHTCIMHQVLSMPRLVVAASTMGAARISRWGAQAITRIYPIGQRLQHPRPGSETS